MDIPIWVWFAFLSGVIVMLALDLGVFNRKSDVISTKQAAIWSAVWVTLSLGFAGFMFFWQGQQRGLEWITGYLIEYSLAVDNIFVFVLVFTAFAVPVAYRRRVLFWGIIGALIMRGAMIALGAALLEQFHWILYVFGGILLIAGYRMMFAKKEEPGDIEHNGIVKLARRFIKISPNYDGQKFFTVHNGAQMATPLFLVLIVIEFTDLVFAVDSIPAIFAVTREPFIVFTSNVMAILGLRSLYVLLEGFVDRFVYLKTGLSVILVFIGAKLLLLDIFKIPTALSLGVVLTVLAVSVIASILKTHEAPKALEKA
jgi:tellurite resistance protein TerC